MGRPLCAPCALPALWGTWGRETAGERNILRSKKISSTVVTTKPYVTATGCNILRSKKISATRRYSLISLAVFCKAK